MPLTKDQAEMLTALTVAARPTGARRWDGPGVMAALTKVRNLDLAEVMMAAGRAARDRDLETPAAIGNTSAPCWRERDVDRSAPTTRSVGPWCRECGARRDQHDGKDHEFEHPIEKRPSDAAHQIAVDLKTRIRPLGDRPTEGEDL